MAAIAGLAANALMKNRRDLAPVNPDFVDTEGLEPLGMDPAPDSPNPAERLQAGGGNALAEALEDTNEGTGDDMFGSTSQSGPYAKAPGLPDLTRGA